MIQVAVLGQQYLSGPGFEHGFATGSHHSDYVAVFDDSDTITSIPFSRFYPCSSRIRPGSSQSQVHPPPGMLIETGIITSHFGDIHNLRAIPIWRMRDTMLRSIYRLYELHLADDYELIGVETEYFFYRANWKVREILDPRDSDPIRYAMLASIVEELQLSINWKLGQGLRRNREHIYRDRDNDPLPPFVPEELPD